ncbi:hypothetical_protein (plasmid) [Leishmania braziliensis MHOM/BR/75/M2904]|uniref:Hypothetical_protein n=1 Tax=Leishmania braziliensis MHOM/BR/75/M2904 TaxID=420245 RepID=A0A3P3Z834_LEIBR|nr:hypothetical_protein [Leishmania braziliensis MHOM/BR/75/M2904]
MEEGFGLGFDSEEDKKAWREVQKQVLFLSHPATDTAQETAHSFEVARRLANAFSQPTESPFFSIAPISRIRAGEWSREPMYCFCGVFIVPSAGVRDEGNFSQSGYNYMRRVANRHFGGAPWRIASSTPLQYGLPGHHRIMRCRRRIRAIATRIDAHACSGSAAAVHVSSMRARSSASPRKLTLRCTLTRSTRHMPVRRSSFTW